MSRFLQIYKSQNVYKHFISINFFVKGITLVIMSYFENKRIPWKKGFKFVPYLDILGKTVAGMKKT